MLLPQRSGGKICSVPQAWRNNALCWYHQMCNEIVCCLHARLIVFKYALTAFIFYCILHTALVLRYSFLLILAQVCAFDVVIRVLLYSCSNFHDQGMSGICTQ